MKFLEAHRIDLLKAFETCGYTKSDFHFIKRKGRIITHYRATQTEFAYILKKDRRQAISIERLEAPQKFEISVDGKKALMDTWEEVLSEYQCWLGNLEKDK